MKIGLIARADNSGLGTQTLEFYKHMPVHKTMVVDISSLNGNIVYLDRYPDAMIVRGYPNKGDINEFLHDLDVVFCAETCYNYWLYERAKELGVKVAVQYNYEFLDFIINPQLPRPDMLIAPSKWHYDEMDKWCKENDIEHVYLHCPVNTQELPYKDTDQLKTFLHIAGRAAAKDRNGTLTVINAAQYLKNPDVKIIIHFQGEQGIGHQVTHTLEDYKQAASQVNTDQLVIHQRDYENYADIYELGDCLILPRRYGGNCLPMNEALGCGMPVIMPDISPNFFMLSKHWLVPARIKERFTPRMPVEVFDVEPQVLAAKIDELASMGEVEVRDQRNYALSMAAQIDWGNMRQKYLDTLEALCRTKK